MIRVEHLSFAYGNGACILSDLSFEIPSGQKVVMLGTNGSGKTTLLKILNGLLFPAEGAYQYDLHPITRSSLNDKTLHQKFRRENVLLFQNPDTMLFNPTVYDEIAFGLRQLALPHIDEKVQYWARLLGLEKYLKHPPFQISSGEKQKVCLAALLSLEPKVLLLDEPTSNLDPRSTGWLVDFLQDLDVTTVVTTHNLSLAGELGDRTMVLSEDHELIFDGEISELLEDQTKLMDANLIHTHKHRHGDVSHRHFHKHDWD
ncbi:MAG: energy-coupling factor ABC transporter ATP-binding protein [Candidatus Eisenbacteria bacterium]|uniref:Energy-coupling factor ABC transporter ATP-binding protein n=1 Tax=Eiseniibacteriota bacterium TaxID=2212470 RepID=A0A948W4X5_UNCEI|nr:energy-coupling factor ABC transporter ATP-binding protein [Candidatus Eisenbacteria bacterium]MBU1947563.1 energy-coupling factor ABC transporter ATP-binding protein [Candidatus Eisenbacteria bacterium]MBU2692707.1 energy-coupling factor ABC transporter ATP-binding protein [Candidatus Eisenbacteria bacterium]